MTGLALSPLPTTLSILLSTASGTALCCASANALNQLQEIPFDAQMARTRTRPLVRRAISPLHAVLFASATGLAGPVILWTLAGSPVAAMLAGGNIALYAGAYTWMKRKSVANTWVGALVGAVPPLIGWSAAGGHILPSPSYPIHLFPPSFMLDASSVAAADLSLIDNPLSAVALFMLLWSWQFPHFNAISYLVRGAYAQAGYRMLSVLDPRKNTLVALRHTLLLVPICSILIPVSGLTTWTFAMTSLLPNAVYVSAGWKWWKEGGEKQARVLFRHSIWYLPVMMGLMMTHKNGVDWKEWVALGRKKNVSENQQNVTFS